MLLSGIPHAIPNHMIRYKRTNQSVVVSADDVIEVQHGIDESTNCVVSLLFRRFVFQARDFRPYLDQRAPSSPSLCQNIHDVTRIKTIQPANNQSLKEPIDIQITTHTAPVL